MRLLFTENSLGDACAVGYGFFYMLPEDAGALAPEAAQWPVIAGLFNWWRAPALEVAEATEALLCKHDILGLVAALDGGSAWGALTGELRAAPLLRAGQA